MRSPDWPQFFQWRRFAVDALTAAATFAVVVATVAANDAVGVLIISGVLIALGMLIEPDAAGNAPSARDAVRSWWRLHSA